MKSKILLFAGTMLALVVLVLSIAKRDPISLWSPSATVVPLNDSVATAKLVEMSVVEASLRQKFLYEPLLQFVRRDYVQNIVEVCLVREAWKSRIKATKFVTDVRFHLDSMKLRNSQVDIVAEGYGCAPISYQMYRIASLSCVGGVVGLRDEFSQSFDKVKADGLRCSQERQQYAAELENRLLNTAKMDTRVSAIGEDNTTLQITYVLMGRVMANELSKNGQFLDQLENLGFKRVEFTDGYGKTWPLEF